MQFKIQHIEPQIFKEVSFNEFKNDAEKFINDSWKIQNNSYLCPEIIKLLSNYHETGVVNITELFHTEHYIKGKKRKVDQKYIIYSYKVDTTCSNCGKKEQTIFSKTALLDYIKNSEKYMCPECVKEKEQKRKEEWEERRKVQEEQYKNKKAKNTERFIETYLNPELSWNKDVSFNKCYSEITKQFVNWEEIKSEICNMEYKTFLNTPYWKAISQKKKQDVNFKCQLCGSNTKLSVHHRTYKNHGCEHERDIMQTDLIVLCDKCHKKFHDIIEE